MKDLPRLEHWSIQTIPRDIYQAPESWHPVLAGCIYGDDRLDDGTYITTSILEGINTISNKARTLHTVYKLGCPSQDFSEYLESIGKNIHDYSHIDISDIKFKRIEFFEIEYDKFEQLIKRVYEQDYDYVRDITCENDSSQSYVAQSNKPDKYDEKAINIFIQSGKYANMVAILLNDLCRREIIEPGNYLIHVQNEEIKEKIRQICW